MQQILSYAINYARNGFPVADEAAFDFNAAERPICEIIRILQQVYYAQWNSATTRRCI